MGDLIKGNFGRRKGEIIYPDTGGFTPRSRPEMNTPERIERIERIQRSLKSLNKLMEKWKSDKQDNDK